MEADGETQEVLTDADEAFVVGLLVGEGHFGGDGRSAQITLRMHARHEPLFRWLEQVLPGSRLYGPYHHGGRHYFQWMSRGAHLREVMLPILGRHRHRLGDHVRARVDAMCSAYGLGGDRAAPASYR